MKLKKTVVLSVMTYKGGVGKSTISANLGYALMELGYKILLIDTDAQQNLSSTYGFGNQCYKNINNVLANNNSILDNIIHTEYDNIDLVPSDELLAGIEMVMFQMHLREFKIKTAIQPVLDEKIYDFIVIDTSATLGILNTAVLHATDYVLIPLVPDAYSVDGLAMFMNFFENVKDYHKDLTLMGMLFNRIDKRKNLSKDAPAVLDEIFGDLVLNTFIPENADIQNAQWASQPLGVYTKTSKARDAFTSLAKEVELHVKNGKTEANR